MKANIKQFSLSITYLVVLRKLMSLNFCLYQFLNEILITYMFVCLISTHFYDLDLSQFMIIRVHSPRNKQSVNVTQVREREKKKNWKNYQQNSNHYIYRGWFPKFATVLHTIIGKIQKLYEWPGCYFAKMILPWGDHFDKRTA